MATIKYENHARIVSIDLDTAEYIIGKIQDAVSATLDNMAHPDSYRNGYEVMSYKDYIEMFKYFNNQLDNILSEIKGKMKWEK